MVRTGGGCFFALVRGACSGISRVAVAADAGAAGCFPQKKRLCECHLYFLCRQLGRSPDREVSRCGVLAKYDNVSFAKSLGTVVTERLVDTLTIFLITGITVLLQMPVFVTFLENTGTKIPSFAYLLTSVWFYIVLFCFIGVVVLLYYLRKTLFFYERVKGFVLNIWEGIMSLKGVRNIPLFIFYTLAIWACYFFHFYFTFYCFAFTAHLGILAALVMFVGGTFAVIVPTPNGAGPWHFAIMEMMMLYGVNVTDAGIFALIVHGIQTFW